MNEKSGVLGIEYHRQRNHRRSHSYRLWRRGVEVARAIHTYCPRAHRLLDIGTADGLMIAVLREMIPDLLVVGLDRSMDLLQAGNHTVFWPLLAEATRLPTLSASFDVISATAIIEHLCNPSYMLRDCHRVLRPGGIIAITTPVPFFERIGTWIGHLPKEQHMHTFDLALLSTMLIQAGFKILEAERFMLSPIGFPCELRIERALKQLGGGKFLLNQIIIGQRLPDQGHGKSIKFSRIAPKYY